MTPSGATATFPWPLESTSATGTYSDITNATSGAYTPVAGDVGDYIEVQANFGTGNYSRHRDQCGGRPRHGGLRHAGRWHPPAAAVTCQQQRDGHALDRRRYGLAGQRGRGHHPRGDPAGHIERDSDHPAGILTPNRTARKIRIVRAIRVHRGRANRLHLQQSGRPDLPLQSLKDTLTTALYYYDNTAKTVGECGRGGELDERHEHLAQTTTIAYEYA